MTSWHFPINAMTARQWLFVGFWLGLGLVLGGASAGAIASLALRFARWLLGAA